MNKLLVALFVLGVLLIIFFSTGCTDKSYINQKEMVVNKSRFIGTSVYKYEIELIGYNDNSPGGYSYIYINTNMEFLPGDTLKLYDPK